MRIIKKKKKKKVLHADDRNEGWRGFAGDGNTGSVRNLDVGAANSLGAVMIMVIIVVERIKRSSRREEVDGSQLKWAVDKSKRNVKGMSCQLVVINRKRSLVHAISTVAGHRRKTDWERASGSGKSRVWTSP
jgi:hypothetical protein